LLVDDRNEMKKTKESNGSNEMQIYIQIEKNRNIEKKKCTETRKIKAKYATK
jgi:hypothetical protein